MRRTSRWFADSFTALFAGAVLLPGLVAVATAAVYLTDWPTAVGGAQLGVGLALGLAAWIALSLLFFRGWARPDGANVDAYDELCVRLASLKGRVPSEAETPPLLVDGQLSPAGEAVRIAQQHTRRLEGALAPGGGGRGLRWLTQSGYVNLWRSVHRAEESLLELEPPGELYAVAVQDRARLEKAPVEGQKELLAELDGLLGKRKEAVETARRGDGARAEALAREVLHAVAAREAEEIRSLMLPGLVALRERPVSGTGGGNGAASDAFAAPRAHAVVREVRYTLDQRRNDLWDRIVHLRNLLLTTMVATGVVAYGLLALAVVRGIDKTMLTAAAVFFLVGATVGLFNELYGTARRKQGIAHDYGLATARLLTVPLLAGVAAVGGVLITRLGASTANDVPTLADVFSLSQYPFGLVVAAIFGLTPGLLLERLQKQTDAYRKELAQTEKGGDAGDDGGLPAD